MKSVGGVDRRPAAMGTLAEVKSAKISYEEFLANLDEDDHAEWVDGEVITMSPVSSRHQMIGVFLLSLIERYIDEHPIGRTYYETFHMKAAAELPGRVPDI